MHKQPKPSSIEVLNTLIKKAQSLVKPFRSDKKSAEKTLSSRERNAHKPCKCGNPNRHKAKSGNIYTNLCSDCYFLAQKAQRLKNQ